jgi:hypothetical protein
MGDMKRAYRVLVGKPDVKTPDGRPRGIWEDNINTDLHEEEWRGMDWIDLAQERDSCLALVNAAMHVRFHRRRRIS